MLVLNNDNLLFFTIDKFSCVLNKDGLFYNSSDRTSNDNGTRGILNGLMKNEEIYIGPIATLLPTNKGAIHKGPVNNVPIAPMTPRNNGAIDNGTIALTEQPG